MELLFNEIAEFNVLELFVRSVLSAFNPSAVATSDALAVNPIDVLTVAMLLASVAESAFEPMDVLTAAMLLVSVAESAFKPNDALTSEVLAFSPIDVFSKL